MDIYGQKVFVFHFIFRKMEAILFIILQIFLQITVKKKCLQKVNCLMCGMFTFQCSLVRFYEQTNMSRSFTTTTKRSLSLN